MPETSRTLRKRKPVHTRVDLWKVTALDCCPSDTEDCELDLPFDDSAVTPKRPRVLEDDDGKEHEDENDDEDDDEDDDESDEGDDEDADACEYEDECEDSDGHSDEDEYEESDEESDEDG